MRSRTRERATASRPRRRAALAAALLGPVLAAVCLLPWAPEALGESPHRKVDRDPAGAPYASGELIVAYRDGEVHGGTKDVARERVPREAQGEVKNEIPELNAQLLSFPKVGEARSGRAREEALKEKKGELEGDPGVASVDYNYLRKVGRAPDDPELGAQYGLEAARFPRAWNRTRAGLGTKIAVVDSGLDLDHPDLAGKVVAQRDFVGAGDADAQDDFGHGTHVAGIAAADTGNGRGVAGACPGCGLLVAKTVDAHGYTTVADEIEGISWAANKGAKVVNLSLGGPGYVRAERNAVDRAWQKGAVVVAAAGNDAASEPYYPAAYPNAIAVSATDRRDRIAPFSDRGIWVDVSAPGVDVVSTTLGGGYGRMSGTSMATPYVSGLAGLLASQGRPNEEIRSRILGTAADLGPKGRDPLYGAGRIDAARAVRNGPRR